MKKMLQTMLCWFPGNQTTQNSDSTVAKLPNDPLNASSARIPTHLSFVRRLVLTCLIIFSINTNAQTQTVILTSGSSWTVPSNVYSITIECWGGGGAGGSNTTTAGQTGGGGGGGAYAKGGGGGAAGSTGAGNNGTNGVTSGNADAAGGAAKSLYGGAGGAGVGNGGYPGYDGNFYGGGGGGAKRVSVCVFCSSQNGGFGSNGAILLTYCKSVTAINAGTDVTICNGNNSVLGGSPTSTAPTTLFSENFESTPNNYLTYGRWETYFIGTGYNYWMYSSTGAITGRSLTLYNDWAGTVNSYDKGTSDDLIAYYATKIDATGFSALKLNFKWKCVGENSGATIYDYGKVKWSLNGTTWNDVSATKYYGQSTTQTVTNLSLAAADGQQFYLGFEWINDGSGGSNPPFTIDDISNYRNAYLPQRMRGLPTTALSPILQPVLIQQRHQQATTTYTVTAT
jgi:hypothetical protein